MGIDEITAVVWRHRRLALLTFITCFAVIAAITFALPRTYRATATVFANVSTAGVVADAAQSETLSRTYAALIGSPSVADEARRELPFRMSRNELLGRMSFSPVERTPLVNVTAEAGSARRARLIANTYVRAATLLLNPRLEGQRVAQRLTVLEQAALPTDPAKPSRPLYLGVGGLLSLLLAGGVALARHRLKPELDIDAGADQVLGHPVLGAVPPFDRRAPDLPEAVADAFRRLRINLEFAARDRARVIVVTSPSASEGKTSVAAHLAMIAANDGDTVTLVEGDLRRPSLDGTALGDYVPRSESGLTELLAGRLEVSVALNPVPGIRRLSVVWAGAPQADPSMVLRSSAFTAMLTDLSARSRWVIIDAPPMSVADDGSVLASQADGVIYVVDARQTTEVDARAGLAQLRRVRADVAGVVLTNARTRPEPNYYRPANGPARQARDGDAGAVASEDRAPTA